MHARILRTCRSLIALACVACAGTEPPLAPAPEAPVGEEPPAEAAASGDSRLRTVYVPAYSHLDSDLERRHMLSVLLSVRNVDASASVTLTHVDYFDTSGRRVRRYLTEPKVLRPLETAEFSVPNRDDAGGSGANFLIYWEGPSDAHPLLTEAVMWGHVGAGYLSFTSRGVELDRRPEPADFLVEPAAAGSTAP
ncbi:MAG: DUF3124 domain-containing protein [Myxococcota bacterium]